MKKEQHFDIIIIGGSYSGLAAGMALGRALKRVLIIDSNTPCNRQTPYSHNFITNDGKTPAEIASVAKKQVATYPTVKFFNGLAVQGSGTNNAFKIQVASGETFTGDKLIFATGIKDIMPNIEGFSECWGISVLHCPYCHGYEVKNEVTGILGNGDYAFEFGKLISNWTPHLTIYTNGRSTLNAEQTAQLGAHNIKIVETEIERLEHQQGKLQNILFKNGSKAAVTAIYTKTPFEQHCTIPETMGCELNEEGYLKTDANLQTNIDGIYACGDNVSRLRTVANAVAMGTAAGMMVNKELVFERFE
ncbi:NAD(P)/FAD-dependent oxidoreductase [Arenibacter sp. F26102]|uniref:NAD(P)/FAD-dependent oxidoreductase n=1 Tax=Arenibacter sp. F26102 TaxID=2926416 RepID=UPI001FF1FF84|nr:NAD(P)/FAD-dependent oxidoreductase [Arenibacter sp. F26102]MCK0147130.1 NAD(P)/FAD-dependent oxidoreductase [Arenibacter sp. F26102]